MNFWAELKRRNVFRVGAAYLVSAWLLIEIADILFPALGFPKFALQLLIVLLALGLVPVMLLAWAYELTPAGFVRDRGPDAEGVENRNTGRRLDQVTIAMILLALGVVAVERFVVPKRAGPATEIPASMTPDAPTVETAKLAPPSPPLPPAPRESVAVLPFANMSPDPENEFFADGIAEELLNVLSGIEGLKVASRTSAFSFKGKQTSIREIGRALNVAHVLEGSVRKQGLKVRITAQLIDAENDKHLWADTYDRDLDDIFAVQAEIAQAISNAMGGALGYAGKSRKVEVAAPTEDLEAYELYLRGRQLFYQRGDALIAARKLLEDAVARDPAFAEAWAFLSAVRLVAPDYVRTSRKEGNASAATAARRARELDDSLALPYAVLARVESQRGDLLEGERLLGEAIRRDPRDSTAWLWLGMHFINVGNFAKAEELLRRAVEIEPLAGITHGWLATVQGLRGKREEAEQGLKRAVDFGWTTGGWLHSRFALAERDHKRATEDLRLYFGKFPDLEPKSRAVVDALFAALDDPGKRAAMVPVARADPYGVVESGWSGTLAALGMHDEALDLELAVDDPDWQSYFSYEIWFPTVREVMSEPRFLEVAQRDGLLAYWNANGFPEGCRIVENPPRHLDCTARWK